MELRPGSQIRILIENERILIEIEPFINGIELKIKGFQKKMVQELEDIKFPVLSKCLSIKYGAKLNDENETIVCDICNTFVAKNNRALATHKRRCSQKDVLTIKTS